jgi:hypothetical protein
MPVKDPCDGCYGIKEAAILAALQRIRLCEAAAEVLASTMWLSATRRILAVGGPGPVVAALERWLFSASFRKSPLSHHAERRRWPAMLIGSTRMKCSGSPSTHD